MTFLWIFLAIAAVFTLLHFVTWSAIKKFWQAELLKLHTKLKDTHDATVTTRNTVVNSPAINPNAVNNDRKG